MSLNLTIEGDPAVIDAGMQDFAKQNGWSPTVPNPNYVEGGEEPATIDNPVAALTYSLSVLGTFFRDNIKAWNTTQAQRQAAATVSAAIDATLADTHITATYSE